MENRKIEAFAFYDVGHRDHYEDRCDFIEITTNANQRLSIAIVCDGVGGVNAGEVAAQLAIDSSINFLRNSQRNDIPSLITEASQVANQAVLQQGGKGKCTLAMAVIHHDGSPYGRLYNVSLGDSRICLIRNVDKSGKKISEPEIRWLNREHNVAEDRFWNEGVDRNIAYQARNATSLTRVLGLQSNVEPDIGFYHLAPSVATAIERGRKGIELREADTVFVCSDGMLDGSPIDGLPVVREEEYLRHGLDTNAESAARTLVSFAKGRQTQDNASLVWVLIAPDSKYRKAMAQTRIPKFVWGALAAILIIAVIGFFLFAQASGDASKNQATLEAERTLAAANETQQASVLGAEQATRNAIETSVKLTEIFQLSATPTPTSTQPPTALPGQVGQLFMGHSSSPQNIISGQSVDVSQLSLLEIWGQESNRSLNGSIYMRESAKLRLSDISVQNRTMSFLSDTGAVLVVTGYYNSRTTAQISGTGISFSTTGNACLMVENTATEYVASCLAGNCSYTTTVGGASANFTAGQRITIDSTTNIQQNRIARGDGAVAQFLWNLHGFGKTGEDDWDSCNMGDYIAPTAVPATATPEPTRAVNTQSNPNTNNNNSGPDSDGDGFADSVDGCPTQGDQGYGVDGNGCPNPPTDSDGDGIVDGEDSCPHDGDQGFGVAPSGCPIGDSDGDGFGDTNDNCPNQGDQGYGLDGSGCPNPPTDGDGDGVFDNDDACPSQGSIGFGVDGSGCPIPDSDGDGVGDNADACPSQGSIGFGVDGSGCPIQDSDGDGVGDNADACPSQGSIGFGVDGSGCPIQDSDGDGIGDNVDACPSQGSIGFGVDGSGCPIQDSDGDGIGDNVDACPTEGSIGFGVDGSGCPIQDSDGDGIGDNVDACPTQGDEGNGVDGSGCPNPAPPAGPPDDDGDGVPNNKDKCPAQGDQGSGVDVDGCPL